MNKDDITSLFTGRFGQKPEVIARAPGRINLIGEHTDYNNGFVLPAAIGQSVWAAIARNGSHEHHFYAVEYDAAYKSSQLIPVTGADIRWANYPMGALGELLKDGCETGGLDIAVGGNIPPGAGLSSSAALISAVILAVNELTGAQISRPDMARIAQRAENNFAGMQCGIMDMFASLMGKPGQVLRLDCRNLAYTYSAFPDTAYKLLLLDSGVKHQLVDSEYNTRRKECEAGVEILRQSHPEINTLRDATPAMVRAHEARMPNKVFRRCLFVTEENNRVHAVCDALETGNMTRVGELMYQSHVGLRDLYEVCVDETNFLVESMSDIAIGSRQMGGGFGGCTINLIEATVQEDALQRIEEAYLARFGIKLRAIPVQISDGAHIL